MPTSTSQPEAGNIFYDKFVCTPIQDIVLINFAKHIEPMATKSSATQPLKSATKLAKVGLSTATAGAAGGATRVGGYDDALNLLKIIVTDHRSVDGDLEPVDLIELIPGDDNEKCREKVEQYLHRAGAAVVQQALLPRHGSNYLI
jgi:hypothetical protein